ncbi:(5-formylfuran-3-yl)methyl phosphate synthase [Methylophilus aquaticus]|uniref:(5-formylfuran-3-yl)methyl phosphate synthase n=1 Tax=Methylophilus aquaticus TaxID=1971610 RepID=A0ABT9JV66_9PROT|nr:(5-formylfuran-3-yl)methyl phosphate synthase [Methylophilus aquaticus]MDP8568485.1 (5-formylfuran-3-yl)methyl phosphate synthase [Methylophilus aquaticus]
MQLLVSVNSVSEASLALSAGVDLLDLKDTTYGALAMLDMGVSQAILQAVRHHRIAHPASTVTVSATIGDDCASMEQLKQRMDARLEAGVDIIKLPATIWLDSDLQTTLQRFLGHQVSLIAVFSPAELAEHAFMHEKLAELSAKGYFGVMVDTIDKHMPVTAQVDQHTLRAFIQLAQSLALTVGVAGGLQVSDLKLLSLMRPDYIGFRSGLCEQQQRKNCLSASMLMTTVEKMSDICQ